MYIHTHIQTYNIYWPDVSSSTIACRRKDKLAVIQHTAADLLSSKTNLLFTKETEAASVTEQNSHRLLWMCGVEFITETHTGLGLASRHSVYLVQTEHTTAGHLQAL